MSQYASAMNTKPGRSALTAGITVGQYSLSGRGATRPPHVRSKTSFVTSIAMSQRTPSHWVAIDRSVPSRRPADRTNASSWTTSGHAGKYGSRPFATTTSPTRTNDAGSRSRSASSPRTKYSGCSSSHGWSGATWLGTKSRISPSPCAASVSRAAASPSEPPNRSSTT